mmetsp:Transcript_43258/g.69355  ORF Transcript_43258/g.69355 Transcript_43258/m.69355 type:complete len:160 (+) Transcript_43258:108-587(+)|eukprot:CAMPEP_0197020768 /NCGR_PEP_ID=MMETSP1384-20130603/1665_1 /TAXON_ID=29189 /ORGANISM="Ammonia sp." /LENGTH=159 /DNA_ID=CAMNT_0042448457 /DNA_START=105 /DNA_END=584 /DNA_ORIENTATION=+
MAEAKQQEIPSSARVWESAVLSVDVDAVWKEVRAVTFQWANDVKSTDISGDVSAVGGTRCIHYNDGTQQTVQIMEISDLRKSVTYNVISSEPAVTYTSATHQITLREVTNPSGDAKAQTFVEWTSDYSNDASISVIEDSRYKKKTAFGQMAKFFAEQKK